MILEDLSPYSSVEQKSQWQGWILRHVTNLDVQKIPIPPIFHEYISSMEGASSGTMGLRGFIKGLREVKLKLDWIMLWVL